MSALPKITPFVIGAVAIIGFGMLGTYLIGQQGGFSSKIGLIDSLYFTIETISTVGYGDIVPVTPLAKAFVILLIALGVSVVFGAMIGVVGDFVSSRFEELSGHISSAQTKRLRNHTVLIGYNATNRLLAENLKASKRRFIIAVEDADVLEHLRDFGYTAFLTDESSEAEIRELGVERARRVVIDLEERSKSIYTSLIVKGVAGRHTDIVVVNSSLETIKYLHGIGIKNIVNPAAMAATKIGQMTE